MRPDSERELIELAAKAAGLDFVPSKDGGTGYINGVLHKPWNPLTDDGDALRLANELQISIFHIGGATAARRSDKREMYVEEYRGDIDAATRRAIVRAARAADKTDKEDEL